MRNKILDAWLDEHSNQIMWQQVIPNVGLLECHAVEKGIVIVIMYEGGHGWDLFTPYGGNIIDETFTDAEARLGI